MPGQTGHVIKYADLVRDYNDPASLPKTFQDAVSRSRDQLEPRQADLDPDMLIAKAFIAQVFLRKLAPFLVSNFEDSVFTLGDTKDLKRAKDKVRDNKKDLASNCDFSRGMLGLRNLDQIRGAITRFGSRGFVKLENEDGESIEFFICDVHDTFSYPDDEKKPGYRNLDIKIAVPVGYDSFHICELQFIHEDCRAAYEASHKDLEAERLARVRARMIENSLQITRDALDRAKDECNKAKMEELIEHQEYLFSEYSDNAAFGSQARQDRRGVNEAAATLCHLDDLRRDGRSMTDRGTRMALMAPG